MRPLRFYLVGFRVSKTINVITSPYETGFDRQGSVVGRDVYLHYAGILQVPHCCIH